MTTKEVWLPDRKTDRQMPDKVIPMCCYASQATQKLNVILQPIRKGDKQEMKIILKLIKYN